MFSLRQVELFIAVSKSRTLIEVAHQYKMSQSAISMAAPARNEAIANDMAIR